MTPETAAFLKTLREKITLGVVGGSDFPKQKEQLGETGGWVGAGGVVVVLCVCVCVLFFLGWYVCFYVGRWGGGGEVMVGIMEVYHYGPSHPSCKPLTLDLPPKPPKTVLEDFDYSFSENGLVAYKDGQPLGRTSINDHLGEENIKAGVVDCVISLYLYIWWRWWIVVIYLFMYVFVFIHTFIYTHS